MNGELKKWNVWLPEKRICQVESVSYILAGERAIFFNCDLDADDRKDYVTAEFNHVIGVIEANNNSGAGLLEERLKEQRERIVGGKATTEQVKP